SRDASRSVTCRIARPVRLISKFMYFPLPKRELLAELRYVMVADGDMYDLYLGVEFERIESSFASDAAVLGTAERRPQIAHVLGVDPEHAGVDSLCHPVSAFDVIRPYVSGKPVAHIVRLLYHFILVFERHHSDHRTEDFLLHHAHRVFRIEQYGRRHIVAACKRLWHLPAYDFASFLFGELDI